MQIKKERKSKHYERSGIGGFDSRICGSRNRGHEKKKTEINCIQNLNRPLKIQHLRGRFIMCS